MGNRYQVAEEWGHRFFATRAFARLVRARIEQTPDVNVAGVALDFTDVEAITVGFADELVAVLADRGLLLAVYGANPDVADAIGTALDRRKISRSLIKCCDLHNQHCEPPSELCCAGCSEASHPNHQPDERCVLEGGHSNG